jgi:hypothetical protein
MRDGLPIAWPEGAVDLNGDDPDAGVPDVGRSSLLIAPRNLPSALEDGSVLRVPRMMYALD